MTTTTGGVRCHNPDACCAGQKPCPSPGACGVEADALELADALDNVARNVVSDRATIQQAAEALRRQHAALQPGYSIDADPQGIRALVADAISGALAFGAQGMNPPPVGHWLTPFWLAAKAQSHDTATLDWLATNFLAADFAWGEPATPVIVIEIPKKAGVTGDLRRDVLAILAQRGGAA